MLAITPAFFSYVILKFWSRAVGRLAKRLATPASEPEGLTPSLEYSACSTKGDLL